LRGGFEARIRELAEGNPMLETATEAMLRARSSLRLDLAALEKQVRRLARGDPVCLRSTTMPGIGTVVAFAHLSRTDGDNGSPLLAASWSSSIEFGWAVLCSDRMPHRKWPDRLYPSPVRSWAFEVPRGRGSDNALSGP